MHAAELEKKEKEGVLVNSKAMMALVNVFTAGSFAMKLR